MELIAHYGHRTDRPLSDLDRLMILARMTPYSDLPEIQRLRIKFELDMQHREREHIRFAPLTEGGTNG